MGVRSAQTKDHCGSESSKRLNTLCTVNLLPLEMAQKKKREVKIVGVANSPIFYPDKK